MSSIKKRTIAELDDGSSFQEGSLLGRIRNTWQFANFCQWVYLFGKAVRIPDEYDAESLEMECLKPGSTVLQDLGLALLKFVSSHRGLTPDLFDEYTRRQFVARAPSQNPFGTDETPAAFNEFDVFTKIRVLQQLTQWVMINPVRIRERMDEQRDVDQASWRIEPYGWDREDRTYFVLDDNRIYRLSEAPPPPQTRASPKKRTAKTYRTGSRSSKRRQVVHPSTEDPSIETEPETSGLPEADDGLGGMKWECVAVTLDEVREFLQTIQNSKDENEKVLRAQIQDHLLPILQQQEESRKRKVLQRERELLNLAKMANAKRSSRIAGRREQQRREEEEREAQLRQKEEAAAALRAEKLRVQLQKERQSRIMSRERRLKDRKARRLRRQEGTSQNSDESNVEEAKRRSSSRQLRQVADRRKEDHLEPDDEEDWVFDCECGVYGHVDDGTHSIACERCNVWQHSQCVGIGVDEAEHSDFHFTCASCRHWAAQSKSPPRAAAEPHIDATGSNLATQETMADSSRHGPELSALPEVPSGHEISTLSSAATAQDPDFIESTGSESRVPHQPAVSKPTSREADMVSAPAQVPSPEHKRTDTYQIHTPAHASFSDPGSKFGRSPLSTPPLFNGAEISSQLSILSRGTTHDGEPLLPPPSGGISPVKHSQNVPCATPSAPKGTGLNMSLTPTLPPMVHQHIPTPPVKVSPPATGGHARTDESSEELPARRSP